ncbi:Fpg/Nei family DNA glycosylase [Actinotalea sp. C106]|uniref:Fpg/Nei family DNA glycosylase n=1 Tax=Actinotalea sp. C106 TaxID=2908644 RepID=UPI0020277447|nr:DNA-formamidopyrimidine glycosylase family protein [Actinotalea sp. C106]
MPEGDILRRAARTLDQALTGQVLLEAELRWPTLAGAHLSGLTVLSTDSYGKHLLMRLEDGRTLHSHLRMEGSWRMSRPGSAELARQRRDPHVRALLVTEPWAAVGHRLGMLDLVATREEGSLIGHLGPDLLAEDFPTTGLGEGLRRLAAQGRTPVAEALLDQRVVAGLGTIYVAESLHVRGIWPWTPCEELEDPATLLMTGRRLMERSVASTTPTATGDESRGRTSRVHGREGQPCRRCGTTIVVEQARQPPVERPVFSCPTCQPEPQGSIARPRRSS